MIINNERAKLSRNKEIRIERNIQKNSETNIILNKTKAEKKEK